MDTGGKQVNGRGIDGRDIEDLLQELALDATNIGPVGAGSWSTGFGFTTGAGDFVLIATDRSTSR